MEDIANSGSVQGWLQLATSLGFTGLAWYLIIVALPKMQERFDSHSDRMFERFEMQMEKQRMSHEGVIKGIVERYESHLDRLTHMDRHTNKSG